MMLYIDWISQGTNLSAILTSTNYQPYPTPKILSSTISRPPNRQATELKQRPKFWECPISVAKKGGDLFFLPKKIMLAK